MMLQFQLDTFQASGAHGSTLTDAVLNQKWQLHVGNIMISFQLEITTSRLNLILPLNEVV